MYEILFFRNVLKSFAKYYVDREYWIQHFMHLSNFSDNVNYLIATFLLTHRVFEVLVIGSRTHFVSHDTDN